MTPLDLAESRWPGIGERVLTRLVSDKSLFDSKTHSLINATSREEARAILLLAAKAAHECGGLKLVLSSEEDELMKRKFVRERIEMRSTNGRECSK